jgi:very-short-patch-repair endonuclease
VYAVGRPPRTALENASAAVLACGPTAALSHRSALCLWGLLKRWHHPPFDVVARDDRRPTGINMHLVRTLTPRDFRTHNGIRTTSAARAILDSAPTLDEKTLRRVINEGLRQPFLSRTAIDEVITRFPLHRGTKLVKLILEDIDDGLTDSPFEDEFLTFCRRYGLPKPQTTAYIAGHRVDAVFRKAKVIVECDGWGFHNTRESFESDRDRDADTLEAAHVTIRVTKRRLRDKPEREAVRLQNILQARTR